MHHGDITTREERDLLLIDYDAMSREHARAEQPFALEQSCAGRPGRSDEPLDVSPRSAAVVEVANLGSALREVRSHR